jgi:hypothetical protein
MFIFESEHTSFLFVCLTKQVFGGCEIETGVLVSSKWRDWLQDAAPKNFHILMAHSSDTFDHRRLDLGTFTLSKNDMEDKECKCFMSTCTGVPVLPIGQFKLLPIRVLENGWAEVWCWKFFCGGRRGTLYVEVQYEMCSWGAMVDEWRPYGWHCYTDSSGKMSI